MARTPDGPAPRRPSSGCASATPSAAGCASPATATSSARSSGRVRRAGVPMAYSAGFSPHPKVSYANAAPTGVASEAEYLEIGVVERCDPERVRAALDASLPPGLDILEVVEAGPGSLADRLEASRWRVVLPGAAGGGGGGGGRRLPGRDEVIVERLTKNGMRSFDARSAVLAAEVAEGEAPGAPGLAATRGRVRVRYCTWSSGMRHPPFDPTTSSPPCTAWPTSRRPSLPR